MGNSYEPLTIPPGRRGQSPFFPPTIAKTAPVQKMGTVPGDLVSGSKLRIFPAIHKAITRRFRSRAFTIGQFRWPFGVCHGHASGKRRCITKGNRRSRGHMGRLRR